MINNLIIMSFYHPWVGGGHRPICLLEQDIYKNRKILYIFENLAEIDDIKQQKLFFNKNLLLVHRSKEGKYTALNKAAKKHIHQNISESEIFEIFSPDYVRSHNPVESFIPFLKYCSYLKIPHIYDQMDFFEGFTKLPWNRESEKWYIQTSNGCVTIGFWLQKHYLHTLNKKMHVIPNGVKREFITNNRKKNKNKNTILYTGSFTDWFDWELLLYIVENRPNYNFLLVGGCSFLEHETTIDEEFSEYKRKNYLKQIALRIASKTNVKFTGQLHHEKLIEIYKSANVGIIPFIVNDITRPCSPLKCYEYIASFLPVVTTNLIEIKNFPLVKVATDQKEFLNYLDESIKTEIYEDLYNDVKIFIQANTWRKHSDEYDLFAESVIRKYKS